ncbi:MAG: DUF1840 domain-containing protein [Pseudomonadota bacterium]
MLTIFKSKAAAEVIMYQKHSKPILDLLGKDVNRGVITADEADAAIARLESEIEQRKGKPAAADGKADKEGQADNDDDKQRNAEAVSFSTRVYPLLEMLRAAKKGGYPVAWGI